MKRIFVVDDSEFVLCDLQGFLSYNGYEIVGDSDPENALQLLASLSDIDAILIDFNMPKLNGLEFLRKARCLAQHEKIPVVIHSAYPPPIPKDEMSQLKIYAWVLKGNSKEALLKTLEKSTDCR